MPGCNGASGMYFYVIYLDPDDEEEKQMMVRADDEHAAMRAVFGSVIQILKAVDEEEAIEEFGWRFFLQG